MLQAHEQPVGAIKRRGRGDDSIYWDQSKNTYVGAVSLGYSAEGKRRRRKVYGKTKTEVRGKLREARREIQTGIKSSARYTISAAIHEWLAVGLKGRNPSTVSNYRILAENHIIPSIGKCKLRDLRAHDVDTFLDATAKTLSTRSIRLICQVLKRAITHAQRRDMVARNVAALVTLPQGQPGRASKALTLDKAHAVIAAAESSRLNAYIVLSLLTGVRTEEARALTWDRVHLNDMEGLPPHVEVWRSVRAGGDTKTKRSKRTLALPPQAVTVLKGHKRQQREERLAAGGAWCDHNLVFCRQLGTPLDAGHVRNQFRAVIKTAGLDDEWTPRELRHSFVSLLSSCGMPVEAIARLVGHDRTGTTEMVYRKELRPVLVEGADVMSALFTPRTGADSTR